MARKLLFLLFSFPLFCSGEVLPDSIPYYFMRQAEVFPQENIYMQTDRTYYMAGDTVWFNIYAVEAVNHTLDSESTFAYVDLASEQKKVVERVKVRKEGATFKGYIALDGKMNPGDYTLNVYTRYMHSEQKKFFCKRIRVGSYLTEKEEERVKVDADYEVDFFPEGGQWIEGELSLVAFKALNSDGLGEDVTGMVLDAHGDTVVDRFETKHLGMGTFPIIYDSKKQYQVVCRNKRGLVKNYDLPVVKGSFWALKAKWNRETLFVGVQKSAGLPDREDLYLTVQCRGKVYYSQRWNNSEEFLRFSSGSLPTGVLHLLLTDKHNVPVSERLVFNRNKKEQVSVSLNTDKGTYAGREQVKITLDVKDKDGQSLSALLSVAVTDGRFDKGESEQNILSALLLSSDLKGYVESPAGYFAGDDFYRMQGKLDLLMMTQGWSRYQVDSLLVGKYRYPETTPEKVQEIKGYLYKGLALNKPAAGDILVCPIRLRAR